MSDSREKELEIKVDNLRKLIRRINFESNQSFNELEQENIKLRDELQQMKLAYSVLDQNCERFQKAINYWKFMYEDEEDEEEEEEKTNILQNNNKSPTRNNIEEVKA